MSQERAILYEEPDIATLLIFGSFVLALNAIDYGLNKLLYCGLVGQILVGIAFGTPGLQWLSKTSETVIVQLGYLGLVLLIYEGGLSTDIHLLKRNLALSSAIAITSIGMPIALSFVLRVMLDITDLQAFAAGAALCSTSLGTTFTILQTTDLSRSKLGVVLAGAAMMDDVVGLILVQIIASLGSSSTISVATVVRPICVSIAFAILVPLLCWLISLQQARRRCNWVWQALGKTRLSHKALAFSLQTAILVALVTAASFAGTSNLFAAYLAGAAISWWDSLPVSPALKPGNDMNIAEDRKATIAKDASAAVNDDRPPADTSAPPLSLRTAQEEASVRCSGIATYHDYYSNVVDRILRPFFFASIGFSIPVADMFRGELVWRGVVYALLMCFAKLVCGFWLVRPSISTPSAIIRKATVWVKAIGSALLQHKDNASTNPTTELVSRLPGPSPKQSKKREVKAQSLYPAAIVGCAMVSRGEIGFLVSAVAQASSLYTLDTASNSSDLFLTVTWAIMLCTITGPVCTGLLTKRVWRLQQQERSARSGRQDPLGIWGARD